MYIRDKLITSVADIVSDKTAIYEFDYNNKTRRYAYSEVRLFSLRTIEELIEKKRIVKLIKVKDESIKNISSPVRKQTVTTDMDTKDDKYKTILGELWKNQ